MGKKRQQDTGLPVNDSTDSSPEDDSKHTEPVICPHIHKSVQLTAVKKSLRDGGLAKGCANCLLTNSTNNNSENEENNQQSTFSICLKCGNFGCNKTNNSHDEKHAKNHQSDPHDLAINGQLTSIWCFKCEKEILPSSTPKLQECFNHVRKLCKGQLSLINKTSEQPDLQLEGNQLKVPIALPYLSNQTSSMGLNLDLSPPLVSTPLVIHKPADGLPRVRGLANLGNTCFFNAVLQCLAQTPYLLTVLKEMQKSDETFSLPGGEVHLNRETVQLEPLDGKLKELGSQTLTKALIDTLTELKSGSRDVYVPSKLRSLLHEKCPQFAGYAEHDSHELLRQLLETVRTEDLQRYKSGILEVLRLERREERDNITDEQRINVRAYGRQASDQLLRPAKVFQGELISTLECQQCQHTTEHIESFLDLSLPVVADKPVHVRRRISTSSEDYYAASSGGACQQPLSKHQSKKERKARTKSNKRRMRVFCADKSKTEDDKGEGNDIELPSLPPGSENDEVNNNNNDDDDDLEGEENSDADAEGDDEDDTNEDKNPTEEVAESGYSSERPGNGDSACGSPNGDRITLNGIDNELSDLQMTSLGATTAISLEPQTSSPTQPAQIANSNITLIPRTHVSCNECTLQSCLNQFTAQELLTGNNKVGCEACTKKTNHGKDSPTVYTNASKQLLVIGPPAVLILHLKRFQVLRFTSRKNSEDVRFPAVLDLAPYCTIKCRTMPTVNPNQVEVRYALYGIVQHSGNMHGGHYVAYVKVRPEVSDDDPRWNFLPKTCLANKPVTTQETTPCTPEDPSTNTSDSAKILPDPPPGKWYYISDSQVSDSREASVLSSEAYLLFYERIY